MKKKCYTLLSKEDRKVYGAFPRNKTGFNSAKKYKEKLTKETKLKFIIK